MSNLKSFLQRNETFNCTYSVEDTHDNDGLAIGQKDVLVIQGEKEKLTIDLVSKTFVPTENLSTVKERTNISKILEDMLSQGFRVKKDGNGCVKYFAKKKTMDPKFGEAVRKDGNYQFCLTNKKKKLLFF